MSNKEKEPYATKKELAEAYQELRNLIGESSSSQTKATPSPEGGNDEVPIYKCKGKDCHFSTDDISDLMLHTVEQHSPKPAPTPEPEAPKKKRHETVEDYLNCPECFPKFEKGFLDRGYVKKEKKESEEETPSEGGFPI